MTSTEKYLFDAIFDMPSSGQKDGACARKRSFSFEEVEAVKRGAYLDGEKSALAQAEQRAADAQQQISRSLAAIIDRLDAESAELRRAATALAALVGRKIGGRALQQFPHAVTEELIETCLRRLRALSHVELRAPAEAVDKTQPAIEALLERSGRPDRVALTADPSLRCGEARLVWDGGEIARDLDALNAEIDEALDAYLQSLEQPAAPATQEDA